MAIDIRLSREGERDAVLNFIKEMGFRPRDSVTWDALQMMAMTAWESGVLIGAIPMEPRVLQIAPDTTVKTVHETAVAIHPEFRSHGIGTEMQQAIFSTAPTGAVLATVFREQPESPAYRWYRKNGFEPVMHIESWFYDHPVPFPLQNAEVYDEHDPCLNWASLTALWEQAHLNWSGGFLDRCERPLREWLRVHPYRKIYTFTIIILRDAQKNLRGYAVLGVGKMNSETERVDILELVTILEEPHEVDMLLQAIITFASTHAFRPIRWPLARYDPNRKIAKRYGMEERWNFDFMVREMRRPSKPVLDLSVQTKHSWRYFSIEYI